MTPLTVALQGLLFMGFSRQEYWSGLPFPSPGDLPNAGTEPAYFASPALAGGFFATSTTWEALCLVTQCLTLCDPCKFFGLQPTRLLCPWGFSKQEYWSGLLCPPPGDFPNPEVEPRSPALQVDALPPEPPEKLKNTGVGNLSLLLGNLPASQCSMR